MGLAPEPGTVSTSAAPGPQSLKVTVNGQTYDWDGEYDYQDMVAIEQVTGVAFLDWLERQQNTPKGQTPRMTDIGLMLWRAVNRTTPVKFEDFNFSIDGWAVEVVEPAVAAAADPTGVALSLASDAPAT